MTSAVRDPGSSGTTAQFQASAAADEDTIGRRLSWSGVAGRRGEGVHGIPSQPFAADRLTTSPMGPSPAASRAGWRPGCLAPRSQQRRQGVGCSFVSRKSLIPGEPRSAGRMNKDTWSSTTSINQPSQFEPDTTLACCRRWPACRGQRAGRRPSPGRQRCLLSVNNDNLRSGRSVNADGRSTRLNGLVAEAVGEASTARLATSQIGGGAMMASAGAPTTARGTACQHFRQPDHRAAPAASN